MDTLELTDIVGNTNGPLSEKLVYEQNKIAKPINNKLTQEEKVGNYIADSVAEESKALFKSIADSSYKELKRNLGFRHGSTLEDLVIELLKPELSEWLNKNLPTIVKEAVEREIKKLVPQGD
jgi:cell pole-organizing protein PopZ